MGFHRKIVYTWWVVQSYKLLQDLRGSYIFGLDRFKCGIDGYESNLGYPKMDG